MIHSRLSNEKLDRIAGTQIGTLWFLPLYSLILGFLVLVIKDESPGLAITWGIVAAVAPCVLGWALFERRAARQLLQQMAIRLDPSLYAEPRLQYDGENISGFDQLVQYQVTVGLMALEAKFQTRPRLHASPILPILITLLLGWWAIPWGPLSTIATLTSNLRGGTRRTATDIVVALREPEKPLAPWWRRMLDLDRGIAHAAANLAVLLILGFLVVIVLFGITRELLQKP